MSSNAFKKPPVFVTLGPAGTNHEMVTANYLSFRGLKNASIVLIHDFFVGLQMLTDGEADFMVQVAVHPDCAEVVATAHFKHGIRVIDTFISPSKILAILTQIDIEDPRTLALQPATKQYADTTAWANLVPVNSISRIAEGLLRREYDSGLTSIDLAERHPNRFRIDRRIGTVDDPWLVYGKRSVCDGKLVASSSSPAIQQFADFVTS